MAGVSRLDPAYPYSVIKNKLLSKLIIVDYEAYSDFCFIGFVRLHVCLRSQIH